MHPLDPLLHRLAQQPCLIIDGGLSAQLARMGHVSAGSLWTARYLSDDPGALVRAHHAFATAGADVMLTATYQAHLGGFRALGIGEGAFRDLCTRSVALALLGQDASDRAPLVAGSVGSYGASLPNGGEYRGHFGISRPALRAFHRPRMEGLITGKPDLLALETLPCLEELEVLLGLLDEYQTFAWVSLSTPDGMYMYGGASLHEGFSLAAASPFVLAIGVNCCSPELVTTALAIAAKVTQKPLLAYPNAGGTLAAHTGAWSPRTASPCMWHDVPTWLRHGARLLGGCCGIDAHALAGLVSPARAS